MNWKRTLVFIAAFDLATTLFLPRHYAWFEKDKAYQFLFLPTQWSLPIDYEQWRLNLIVATLLGFLFAQLPTWWNR